jgi:hypothetical protein
MKQRRNAMPTDLNSTFRAAQYLLQRDGSLTNAHLARVVEAHPDEVLPQDLHKYLVCHLRGEVKHKRGRRARNAAAVEFALFDAEAAYETKLRYYQSCKDGAGKGADYMPPQERAYRDVLAERRDVFPGISWLGLKNMVSKNKRANCEP